jgi:hypothetical protein
VKPNNMFSWIFFLLFAGCFSMGTARGQTRIAESGATVLVVTSPKGKAVVTIRTATLTGTCGSACPASGVWLALGSKQSTVVEKMDISIDGQPVGVPLSVYADMFQPGNASLRFENGGFVLRIDGGDGGESYFVLIYFDAQGVDQLKVFDPELPDHPTQVTRFYFDAYHGE